MNSNSVHRNEKKKLNENDFETQRIELDPQKCPKSL